MLVRCVHCDTELVAPARSEYWSDKHACHIWLCPKCFACFSSVILFSCRREYGVTEEYLDTRPFTVSVAAGRLTRQDCSPRHTKG
jgi:hypothetical protein